MVVKSDFPDVPIPNSPFYQVILDAVWSHASLNPNRIAVIDGENESRTITFREIFFQSQSVATFLHSHGFGHGDVAAVTLPNCWEYSVFFLGAAMRGGVVSGASPMFTDYELERQFNDCKCKVVFTIDTALAKVRVAAAKCPSIKVIIALKSDPKRQLPLDVANWDDMIRTQPDCHLPEVHHDLKNDLQLLPYSSGTTGAPKGVMLTHYNLVAMHSIFSSHSQNIMLPQIDPNWQWDKEVQLLFLPYSHIYGFFLMVNALVRGATAVVLRHFDAHNYLNAIQKYRVRMLNLVPPILVFLAKHPIVSKYDISSVEFIMSGAAPAGKDLCEELKARHPHVKAITQGYGMTEMGMASHLPVIEFTRFGNAGKLASNYEAKVVDVATGKECGRNEKGELWVRSPSVMKGYLNRKEATEETIDADGWLHTGDIGYHDDEGYLFIVDRLKELIKVRGFQVPPAELEDLLLSHPGVQDAAVIGVPDQQAGELPRAFIVRRDESLTETDVAEYVKSKVSYYKQLKGGVEFLKEIPKSPSGKILRRFLRDRMEANAKAKL
uniref:Uncharacterized protein n=1 Tax=Plectus sambesii TaxID=2011161 RepID=A0A914WG66_9BILA